jgi:hypothetical protein
MAFLGRSSDPGGVDRINAEMVRWTSHGWRCVQTSTFQGDLATEIWGFFEASSWATLAASPPPPIKKAPPSPPPRPPGWYRLMHRKIRARMHRRPFVWIYYGVVAMEVVACACILLFLVGTLPLWILPYVVVRLLVQKLRKQVALER